MAMTQTLSEKNCQYFTEELTQFQDSTFTARTTSSIGSESGDTFGEHAIPNRLSRGWTAIFIDGSSLYYAAQQLGIEIDYTKLLRQLVKNNRFLRAYFYTGVDRHHEKQQGFLLWMRHNGYRVITKDLVQLPDNTKKVSLDVEIAVDMMKLVDHCETMILVSGDGNLSYAVSSVAYQGVQVEVVSIRSMMSESLMNVADCFTDLETMKQAIRKSNTPNYVYRPLSSG